jgi:arylsulfatase A
MRYILLSLGFCLNLFSQATKPNIVLIMADDVSWEAFGSYGAEDYKTPNLDKLAANGVQFNHCYSTPICTTSRVKIMTGKYNFRNYTHFGYLNPLEKTFGHLLQEAGYKTAIAGKWQLNGLYNMLDGATDNTRPFKAGFNEYCLWQLTKQKKGGGERFWSPAIEKNGKFITAEENKNLYGPDLFTDFLCDFMERNQKDPFFVYYPMVLVHDPFVPTPDTIGKKSRGPEANKEPKSKEEKKENFVAMVQYADKLVGRIVKKLDDLGQLENTIVLFTADNGTHPKISSLWKGQQIKGGKGGMTDMGTHVPLIASWKGRTPAGIKCDDLVDFTDFYRTFADAAQVSLGEKDPLDGVSFLPQLTNKEGEKRDWVLCHYQPYWNKKSGQYLRNQTYKLYRDGRFFEVPKDLQERNNLSTGLERAETQRQKLQQDLDKLPPAPAEKGNRNTKERPVYPDWRNLND